VSGVASAADASFEVNITAAPDSIPEGDPLTIEFNVSNTGNQTGEREIVLQGNGQEVNRTPTIQLDTTGASAYNETNLTWQNPPQRPERELRSVILVEGGDADGTDSSTTEIQWNETDVRDFTVNQTSVSTGAGLNFTGTIRNIGTKTSTREIFLNKTDNNGNINTVDTTTNTIMPEGLIPYTNQATAPIVPGTYKYTLSPEAPDANNAESVTITVDDFDVNILDTTVDGGRITVDAEITKNGTHTATQDVYFDVEGVQTKSKPVTVKGTEPTTVTFDSNTGNPNFKSRNISVRTQKPAVATKQITSTNIQNGPNIISSPDRYVQPEQTATISYTADGPDVDTVEITVTDPNGDLIDNTPKVVTSGSNQQTTVTFPTRKNLVEGKYDVRLEVEDDFGGQTSTQQSSAFIVPNTNKRPVVKSGPKINNITNTFVRAEEKVTINYSAAGRNVTNVILNVTDRNGDSVGSTPKSVPAGVGQETTVTLPTRNSLVDDEYIVRLKLEDKFGRQATALRPNAFRVADIRRTDSTNEFSQDSYRSPAGDFVQVEFSTDFDEAFLLIGGDKQDGEANLQNHIDILHVTGDTDFVINTRLVGTDRPSEDVYIPIEGDVTSYAHSSIGAAAGPQKRENTVFESVRFEGDASSLAEFREQLGFTSRGAPLQADRYRLVAGGTGTVMIRDQNIPDLRRPIDRSNLVLTQPELRDVNTYVLPAGSANELDQFAEDQDSLSADDLGSLLDDATESDYISHGDRILVEVKATGMYGASLDGIVDNGVINGDSEDPGNIPADKIGQLNSRHEGVEVSLGTKRYAGANHGGSELQFEGMSNSEIYVLPDDTTDQWSTENESLVGDTPTIGGAYFIIDTRGTNPFDNRPRENDILKFEVEYQSPDGERFQYDDYSIANGDQPNPFNPDIIEPEDGVEHFPYFGDSETTVRANSSFEVLEPTVRYDRTTPDGDLVVPAESDGKVTGFTSIAPGSDVSIQFIESERPNQELVTIEDVDIEDDRLFTAEADFSQLDPSQRVEVEFYSNGRLVDNRVIDKRGATVVNNFENPAQFNITSAPESVAVEQRGSLGAINATINNTGSISGRKLVEFRVDNETISEESVFLSAGTNTTRDLSDRFVTLPAGEYPYTISTEDDILTGQLTVTAPESGTEITNTQNATSGTNSSPVDQHSDPTDTDDNKSDSDPSLFGAIGLRGRDVAAATAITGAVHILGFWS
jgi:hypothetical protein